MDDCLIGLEGLRLQASIGIYAHELAAPQPLDIDLRLAIDGTLAGRSDDIRHTVDLSLIHISTGSCRASTRCGGWTAASSITPAPSPR